MWLSKLLYVLLGTALLALTSCERGGSGGWDPAPQEDASESSDGAWSADTEAPPNTALDQGAGAGADAGPDATDSSVALGPQPDAQQPSGGGGSDATDYGFDAGPQGPACADYCALHAHCTRDNALYASESDCLMQCGAWARWPAGLEGDSENTIACRLAQLEAIAEGGSPDEHCSAAGPTGGDVCGSWCDNYCALALANCTGTHTLYSGEVDCQIACSNIPEDGEHYAVEGDSVQCRIRQLMLAGSDRGGPAPGQYCPAASLSGAPPCGRASGIGCGEADRFNGAVCQLPPAEFKRQQQRRSKLLGKVRQAVRAHADQRHAEVEARIRGGDRDAKWPRTDVSVEWWQVNVALRGGDARLEGLIRTLCDRLDERGRRPSESQFTYAPQRS